MTAEQLKSFTTSVSIQQNDITQKAAPCNVIDFIKKDARGKTVFDQYISEENETLLQNYLAQHKNK